MSLASLFLRTTFRHSDNKRDAGLTTPEDICRFDNIFYGPDREWNLLDVYRPKNSEGKLPVIVSVHGGGWVYGDKDRYQYYCMSLARHGFAVVNYSYRLAPKHKFPSSLEDTNLVFHWVLKNARQYGFDCENIFAVGDSAGAHNLALYCCICTNPGYAAAFPFTTPAGFRPSAVALNCGIYKMEKSKKRDLTTMLMADFLPGKGSAEEMYRISATEHLTGSFPPTFLMTCEGDFLAEAAKPMLEGLLSLGIETEYHYYGDTDHVLGHVFHCNIRLPEAQQCNEEECAFFRKHIT